MPGWTSLQNLIDEERRQLVEEGVQPDAAANAADEAHRRRLAGAPERDVWAPFDQLPRRPDFPYVEPDGLGAIRAERAGDAPRLAFDPSDETLRDKMLGAWLGRCAGCALGKPVEGFMGDHGGLRSWERQKAYLTAIAADEWPLRDYYPQHSPAESQTGTVGCPASTRERIAFMETDDDIRYTVLGQVVLDAHGRRFASSHVAAAWLRLLTYQQVCTAETQAYRNMVLAADQFRHTPNADEAARVDEQTDWRWITHHLNPYREWIGAQIRIDSYGYAAAGDPELAAEFAWRDARISHVKNGVYGAMFCAAMIAAAFAAEDPQAIVAAGLAQIPARSRLHADIRTTIDICSRHGNRFENFEAVFGDLYDALGHYHPVHTNNNAAVCVAAVILGGLDFHRGITLAVMGGWDTDCNGATVGSIVGAVCGGARVPRHWSGRLNDTLHSAVIDYHPIAISACAEKSAAIWRRVRSEA